ncbi:MAG TPA: hydrogenase nickel incorporation protein HypB [Actinocrinis sp.]|jgi:hydrogenase nickel incorporation protein HypB|uniref:hydrogenase nickel incorporation protein HypB n=1 Tax=Actinocrinis sp. TaxID=1920516 RepID=UPI002DDCBC26|nr:hydrogenase nickel incorporation protein HypB [Actinocrinis sp.]HEV3168718.1 hydrogenase nickel incorporation protein HypB [Actinocrinis sp.]
MCETCGCGEGATTTVTDLGVPRAHEDTREHEHDHARQHHHDHDTHDSGAQTVTLEERVLAKNDLLADRNRERLAALGAVAVNVMGSPGAGKTALLERTVRELGPRTPLAVVEGDQETLLDAKRIAAAGGRVVQVNTGAGCHLDAAMLAEALDRLAPSRGALVLVENVGNLVCPALFDLGARTAAVLSSVTEGADKPLKYPHMFRAADAVVLTKIDILPYVDFDADQFIANARKVHPGIEVLRLSSVTGEGLDQWFAWLDRARLAAA